MNISRIFILRPIATSLLMVALLLSGLLAYHYLPMAALPQIDYPTIQVQTLYPGASSEVMAAVVTSPLERQLGTMSGLVQMTSLSSAGASVITLQFDLSVPLDVAEQEVHQRGGQPAAIRPAQPAGLQQGQPGGPGHHDAGGLQ